jgi:hypothetical protein
MLTGPSYFHLLRRRVSCGYTTVLIRWMLQTFILRVMLLLKSCSTSRFHFHASPASRSFYVLFTSTTCNVYWILTMLWSDIRYKGKLDGISEPDLKDLCTKLDLGMETLKDVIEALKGPARLLPIPQRFQMLTLRND